MFDESWEIWVVCWHGGFLALLLLLLVLACCDCWPSLHHRRIHLDRAERNSIQALVDSRIQELKTLVKDVIIARLDDGEKVTNVNSLGPQVPFCSPAPAPERARKNSLPLSSP